MLALLAATVAAQDLFMEEQDELQEYEDFAIEMKKKAAVEKLMGRARTMCKKRVAARKPQPKNLKRSMRGCVRRTMRRMRLRIKARKVCRKSMKVKGPMKTQPAGVRAQHRACVEKTLTSWKKMFMNCIKMMKVDGKMDKATRQKVRKCVIGTWMK